MQGCQHYLLLLLLLVMMVMRGWVLLQHCWCPGHLHSAAAGWMTA